MRGFYIVLILSLSFCNLSFGEIYKVDFGKGLKDWRLENGRVESTPSGLRYCHLELMTNKGSSMLVSPTISLGENKEIEISFQYKTNVTDSSRDRGAWVFTAFKDDKGKSCGTRYEVLSKTEIWTKKSYKIKKPSTASKFVVQFRFQEKVGAVDFKDISISLSGGVAERKDVNQSLDAAGLEKITSFKLIKDSDGYALSSGDDVLKPQKKTSSYPVSFILPKKYCDNKELIYQVDASFVPAWDSRKKKISAAIFALGRNMSGAPYMLNSATATVWKNSFYSRVTPEFIKDARAIVKKNVVFTPAKEYHVSLRFDSTSMEEVFNNEYLGKQCLPTPFLWPENRPFMIGSEKGKVSVFKGEIKSFELSIYKKVVNFEFDKSIESSYFYGASEHKTKLFFPDANANEYELEFKIWDIDGKTMGEKLSGKRISNSEFEFSIPKLPYGWYDLSCLATMKGHKVVKNKSFVIIPEKPERVEAEKSAFGISQPVRNNAFEEIDQLFAISAEAGIRWWRFWLKWEKIEPEPGKFKWDAMDKIVDLAEKHGLELYPIMDGSSLAFQRAYTPPRKYILMSPQQVAPPMDVWKRYLKNFAERYKGRIKYYQIWNEPDTRCGFYPFTAEKYIEILKAGAETLRAVDKDIQVGLGGFCVAFQKHYLEKTKHKPDDSAWGAAEFYNLNPQAYFDITDLHLYSMDCPGQFWDVHVDGTRKMMKFLERYGEEKKPVWNSETCFVDSKTGISEKEQAHRVLQWYTQSFAVGIDRNFWYVVSNRRSNRGITYSDYTPKPSFASHSSTVREFKDMKYSGEETEIKNLRAYHFQGRNKRKTVAWTLSGKKILACRSKGSDNKISARDIWGNPLPVKNISGCTMLEIGAQPIFIESNNEIEMKELVSFALPDKLIKGKSFDLKFSLNNPADKETEYSIYIADDGKTIAGGKFKVPAQTISEGALVLNMATDKLSIETKTSGGIEREFFHEFDCNFKKSLILRNDYKDRALINKKDQLQIGNELIDWQGRVSAESMWKGTEDLSAEFFIKRNDNMVDFIVNVTDDIVIPSVSDKALYNGDCVELFIDFRGKNDTGLSKVYQVLISADGRFRGMRDALPENFSVKVEKTKSGYVAKGSFKVPELENNQFGFDVALDDSDTNGSRKTQMIWAGTKDNHVSPEKYGLVILN